MSWLSLLILSFFLPNKMDFLEQIHFFYLYIESRGQVTTNRNSKEQKPFIQNTVEISNFPGLLWHMYSIIDHVRTFHSGLFVRISSYVLLALHYNFGYEVFYTTVCSMPMFGEFWYLCSYCFPPSAEFANLSKDTDISLKLKSYLDISSFFREQY